MVSLILSIITKHLFIIKGLLIWTSFYLHLAFYLPSVGFFMDLLNIFHLLLRDGLMCSSTGCLQHLFTLYVHMCAHAGSTWVGCALNYYDPPPWGNFYSGINLLKINIFTSFFLPPDQVFQQYMPIETIIGIQLVIFQTLSHFVKVSIFCINCFSGFCHIKFGIWLWMSK